MEIHTRVRYLEKLNARDTAIFLTAWDKSRLAYVGNAIFTWKWYRRLVNINRIQINDGGYDYITTLALKRLF